MICIIKPRHIHGVTFKESNYVNCTNFWFLMGPSPLGDAFVLYVMNQIDYVANVWNSPAVL